MRDAVKFFLDRMETNPEEFTQDRSGGVKHNWIGEINSYKKFFTEEEGKAVFSKLGNINLETLKKRITYKLLESEQEEKEELSKASLQNAIKQLKELREEQLLNKQPTKMFVNPGLLDTMKEQILKGEL